MSGAPGGGGEVAPGGEAPDSGGDIGGGGGAQVPARVDPAALLERYDDLDERRARLERIGELRPAALVGVAVSVLVTVGMFVEGMLPAVLAGGSPLVWLVLNVLLLGVGCAGFIGWLDAKERRLRGEYERLEAGKAGRLEAGAGED